MNNYEGFLKYFLLCKEFINIEVISLRKYTEKPPMITINNEKNIYTIKYTNYFAKIYIIITFETLLMIAMSQKISIPFFSFNLAEN